MVNVANIVESSFSGLQSKIHCYAGEGRNLYLINELSFHSTKGYLKILERSITKYQRGTAGIA